jgi:hypothetical protein
MLTTVTICCGSSILQLSFEALMRQVTTESMSESIRVASPDL